MGNTPITSGISEFVHQNSHTTMKSLPLPFASTSVLVACALFVTGCSDARPIEVQKRRDNLETLAKAYLGFEAESGNAPANVTEFLSFLSDQPASPALSGAQEALEEGDIVVNWGGDLGNVDDNANRVLAFEARAPASGGYVVMADGQVRLMSGKEFSTAPMLEPSSP